MGRIFRSIIRTSAFLRKEIFEILRQPRLVFTLVLGPFLILLIFGIGYRAEAPSLRTVFVVREQDAALAQQVQEYATSLGSQLVFMGVTYDEAAAMEALRKGDVDLVAVAPANAYETVRSNQQAVFELYHREIDPFQVDYVNYFGRAYVDEVNRRVLQAITAQGQTEASSVHTDLSAARQSATALRLALEANDEAGAALHQRDLFQNLDSVSLAIGASLGVLNGIQQTISGKENTESAAILASLAAAQQNTQSLGSPGTQESKMQQVSELETSLIELETNLQEFQSIDSGVLVSPFRSETRGIAPIQPDPTQFFAPAVLALLIQHLAVTFAALSIVRERSVGTMELFRVSPLSAAEALIGKYLSYLLLGGFVAAALTLLLIYGLRLPMLGSWLDFILVLGGVLFTSLGIGFVISIFSETDSQAVQYTMIVLLTSVFFSGFLMALSMLWEPVRVISWALPTTYGIVLLREVALRGNPVNMMQLAGLYAIGLGFLVISWLMMRRLISSAR